VKAALARRLGDIELAIVFEGEDQLGGLRKAMYVADMPGACSAAQRQQIWTS
jgi:hypothetical protein